MDKIEQINKAIEDAENLKSKLTQEVFSIGGFTSNKIRHLLNNIGALSEYFLEIGSLRGATFVATVFDNKNIHEAYSIDNFSELNDGTVKEELLSNIKKFITNQYMVCFIEQDCFVVELYDFPKIDLYCYDGNHSYESQKKALTYFYPALADEFILCVDDANWPDVIKGTQDGILECGLETIFAAHLGINQENEESGWWNGFYVALLKKTK